MPAPPPRAGLRAWGICGLADTCGPRACARCSWCVHAAATPWSARPPTAQCPCIGFPPNFPRWGPRWRAHAQEPCSPAARSPSLCVQSEEGGKRGWRERGQEGAGKREGQEDTCVCVLYTNIYREREREGGREIQRDMCVCVSYIYAYRERGRGRDREILSCTDARAYAHSRTPTCTPMHTCVCVCGRRTAHTLIHQCTHV